jgi:hypothetical protein
VSITGCAFPLTYEGKKVIRIQAERAKSCKLIGNFELFQTSHWKINSRPEKSYNLARNEVGEMGGNAFVIKVIKTKLDWVSVVADVYNCKA